MAYATVIIPSDGVTTLLAVDFALGYISRDMVRCRAGDEVDGTGDPVYRNFTFIQPGWAQVEGSAPPVGQDWVFQRIVPKTELVVDWEDDNPITKENLNKMQLQGLHYSHELDDRTANLESSDFQSQIDAEIAARKAGDAAVNSRVDNLIGDVTAQANRAEAAANRSESSATESEYHAQVSHSLVEAAVAGFQGFTEGMAYDFGWINDEMTYFNRDWGTI